ncbi:MAG: tRNA(His) guanylyltransferase Thg1 family protein [Christensenellales bacterium]
MAKEKYSYGYAQEKYKPLKQKEEKYNLKLKKGNYYIIRFDGKEMTATFKIDHQAINKLFFDTMEETFNEFCKSTQNAIFGYSFSDEISILIRGGCNNSPNNRIEKLLSLLSGKLSLTFYRNAKKHKLDLQNKDWVFDARIIELNKQEVINYFLARQAYAIDKYLMQLKAENHIDYKLHTSATVISELKLKGVHYENLPQKYRYGLIYSPVNQICSFEFDVNTKLLYQMCFNN